MDRRSACRLLPASALAAMTSPHRARAAQAAVTIGFDLSLTGADAETAKLIRGGFLLAIDEANAKVGPAGIHVNVLMLEGMSVWAMTSLTQRSPITRPS